jgi:hypothetical protein
MARIAGLQVLIICLFLAGSPGRVVVMPAAMWRIVGGRRRVIAERNAANADAADGQCR